MIVSPALVAHACIEKLRRGSDPSVIALSLQSFLSAYSLTHLQKAIYQQLARKHTEMSQNNSAEIVIARGSDMSDTQILRALELHAKQSSDVPYQVTIDKTIIAGYIVKYNRKVYDNSVRQKLDSLTHKLLA